MRKHNERMECPDKEMFIQDVTSGMKVKELREKYNVSHVLITRWKNEFNLINRFRLSQVNEEEFFNDCKTMSYKELMSKYKISQDALQEWKRKLGAYIKPRDKTNEEFIDEVYDKYGNDYTILEDYIGSRAKIKIKHNKCGHVFVARPSDFLTVKECPKCTKEKYAGSRAKGTDNFKKEVLELVGEEYSVLEEYKKANIKIKMKHNLCGNIYHVQPNNFLNGSRCPKCSMERVHNKTRKPQSLFKKQVREIYGDEFSVVGKYINMDTKIEVIHNDCGRKQNITPRTLLYGCKCQYCQSQAISFGEIQIQQFCEKHLLNYEREYRIDDCRNKYPLPFDFAIFDTNDNLECLIEYDGELHYQSIDCFGGDGGLKYRKRNDSIKTKYCIINKIPLIRIHYNQKFNIEKILSNELLLKEEFECYE